MSRLVLIDAYNALFRLGGGVPEDRDDARRMLVRRAEEALRLGAVRGGVSRAHLVFDTLAGAERAGLRSRHGRVSWHYAHGSADDAILDHLRRHEGRSGGPSVVLVTDDRELGGRARQLGARVLAVRAFFVEGAPGVRPERPRGAGIPRLRPGDFGLPDGPIDLTDPDADLDQVGR